MDEADDKAGRKIEAAVLALWGAKGAVGKLWNVLVLRRLWIITDVNRSFIRAGGCGRV